MATGPQCISQDSRTCRNLCRLWLNLLHALLHQATQSNPTHKSKTDAAPCFCQGCPVRCNGKCTWFIRRPAIFFSIACCLSWTLRSAASYLGSNGLLYLKTTNVDIRCTCCIQQQHPPGMSMEEAYRFDIEQHSSAHRLRSHRCKAQGQLP